MRKSVVKFNASALKSVILNNLVQEQTNRLIDYAISETKVMGDMIQTYHSRHHMDRTGNLLNSLCWGVICNGKMEASGFYRDAVTHSRGKNLSSTSWLHEFFQETDEEVNGRELAKNFLKSQSNKSGITGWRVFFAILAPYWGYWESGFTMKSGGASVYNGEPNQRNIPFRSRFMQFQVMTHIYDDVRMDLKPAETKLTVYVPKYMYRSRKWNRKLKGRVGVKRYALNQKWHK